MSVEYRIISIGTLSRNRLWSESAAVRTAHATTTLVTDESRRILVDPSLPGPILAARYNERTGRQLSDVTDVFCTTLRPVHRRGIGALAHANWWVGEQELASYRGYLENQLDSDRRIDTDGAEVVETELKLLQRFRPAPRQFTGQVQLYPLAGPSAGSTGLLLTPPTSTIIIAGDGALTGEHVSGGQVWRGCADTESALESLRDLVELADIIVPGHDNVMLSPGRWM